MIGFAHIRETSLHFVVAVWGWSVHPISSLLLIASRLPFNVLPALTNHVVCSQEAIDKILKPGIDVVWIFSGKVLSHEKIIRDVMKGLGWSCKAFHVIYDSSGMKNAGYYKRARGLANAGAAEMLFLAWKGSLPRDLAKTRLHVDKGSATYVNYLTKVPVCSPGELALVSRDVKEATMAWSVAAAPKEGGHDVSSESGSGEDHAVVEPETIRRKYAKRNSGRALLRQASKDEVIWFPYDNSSVLMREPLFVCAATFTANGLSTHVDYG